MLLIGGYKVGSEAAVKNMEQNLRTTNNISSNCWVVLRGNFKGVFMFDKCNECIHNVPFDTACNHCCEEGSDVSNFESKYDKLVDEKFRKGMRNEIKEIRSII